MIFLNGSPVYMRGRFYGLQSIPSVPFEPPKGRSIIQYGQTSGLYSFKSTEEFTISKNLTRDITLDPISSEVNELEEGWIVYIYGGNQTATSRTEIELKIQQALSIMIQVDRTFRADQIISLVLRSDSKKNMQGFVKSYNDQTGQMVVDITSFNGEGTYPIGPIDFWDITISDNKAISMDYMLARINSVDFITDPSHPVISVTAYEAGGEGTYDNWTIFPQWNKAINYVRNLNHSAYEASTGPSENGLDGGFFGATFLPFQGESTSEFHNTSSPPFVISYYTEVSRKGAVAVMEDEYEISRPYLKRQVTSDNIMETTTVTTTITYDSQGEPTYNTVTQNDESSLARNYTFSDADFNPADLPNYTPGAGAFYANGELVAFPTPSKYSRNDLGAGSITYVSYDFYQLNEEYFPDGPEAPPSYRPVLIKTISKGIGGSTFGSEKPQPDWFFWLD